jgi:hypothetical protein
MPFRCLSDAFQMPSGGLTGMDFEGVSADEALKRMIIWK